MRPASSHSPRRCRAHALAGPAARLSRLRLPRSGQGQAAAEGARPLPGPAARSRKDARAHSRALGDNRGRRVHPRRLRPRGQERRTGSAVCMGQCRTNAPACRGFLRPPKARAALGPGRSRHSPEPSPSPALAPPTDAQVRDTGQDLAPPPRRRRGSCKLQGRPPPSVASDTAPPKAGAGARWP